MHIKNKAQAILIFFIKLILEAYFLFRAAITPPLGRNSYGVLQQVWAQSDFLLINLQNLINKMTNLNCTELV